MADHGDAPIALRDTMAAWDEWERTGLGLGGAVMRRTDASDREGLAIALRYWLAALVATLIVILLVLLFVRSLTRHITQQLSARESGVVIAVFLVAVSGLRAQVASIYGRLDFRLWLPLPIVVLFAIAVSRHTADANATTVVWLFIAAGEMLSVAWWNRPAEKFATVTGHSPLTDKLAGGGTTLVDESTVTKKQLSEKQRFDVTATHDGSHISENAYGASEAPASTVVDLGGGRGDESSVFDGESSADESDEFVTQAIVRSLAPDGSETITGHVRVEFGPNEKHGSAHLSFTPPLARVPTISLEQSSGPSATIVPGAVYAHGARFDLRLQEVSANPASVRFEFYVHSSLEKMSADTGKSRGAGSDT